MDYIITDIGRLYGIDTENRLLRRGEEMSEFPYLENAWLHVKDGRIAGFGSMDEDSMPPLSYILNS